MNLDILTNNFLDIIKTVSINLDDNNKNYIIYNFKQLNWVGLNNYYLKTSRQNLVKLYFVLWKIIYKSNDNILINKFLFDYCIIKKMDNGLQNMLWEILCPDDIELS